MGRLRNTLASAWSKGNILGGSVVLLGVTPHMRNKFFVLFAATAMAIPSFFAFAPLSAANAAIAPNSPAGNGTSLNWSGYTATGGTFTSVGASWTVPASAAPSGATANTLSADATWVGIGGVSSRDLIQAGTQTVFQDGAASYEAWYETLPDSSQQVPLTIHPGDSVTVSLAEQSGSDLWNISFTDHTTGQNYSTSINYQSSLSSAEWIEEMPSASRGFVTLDNFGTASFTGGFTVENGAQVSLAGANAQPLTMINDANTALATPSSLGADGASFTITRTSATASASSIAPQTYVVTPGGNGGGRWTRTGVGVQGYTAPTRTYRVTVTETGTGVSISTSTAQIPAFAQYGFGGYGFTPFRFGNFSVFFRTFENNFRNGWDR